MAFALAAPIISNSTFQMSFRIFFAICIIASLLYIFVPSKNPVFVAMIAFLGRIGICPCYSLTFLASNDLFPPELKSTLLAFCNIIARSLCLLAPLVAQLKDPIPFEIFGLLALICGVATQFLKYEKKKQPKIKE